MEGNDTGTVGEAMSPEMAIGEFMAAYASGTLSDLDFFDADELARTASSDPGAVANAFGMPYTGISPEDVYGRMMSVYSDVWTKGLLSDFVDAGYEKEANRRFMARDAMVRTLGMTSGDIEKLDFDKANGDPSSWLKAKEDYVFG